MARKKEITCQVDSDSPRTETSAKVRNLLEDALVEDDDPRFPIWLPLPGIMSTASWAFYAMTVTDNSFIATLIWPGIAIFILVTLATWLGWQLDID